MKRNLLISLAFVALLGGCKDNETTANEKLTEAVAQVVVSESAATQTEAHASLMAARDLLAEIRTDLPGTAAALKVVSGETIGTVDLSQLDSLIAIAARGMKRETCATTPSGLCMLMIGLEAEAARHGVSVDEFLQGEGDPQDFFNYYTLLDGGPDAAKALAGQTRTAPDRELFDVLYRLVTLGHEEAAKTWLEVTTPAPGSILIDWPVFLQFAHEAVQGRNLVQTPVTMAAMARLAESEGALADRLVTRIGGLEALTIALGDEPIEKLAEWRQKDWVRAGSDAEGLIAVILWNAGEKDTARAIFATVEMTQNDFVIGSLPSLATPEARADLLAAALPAATDALDRARIVMALIGLGDEAAATPALVQIGLEPTEAPDATSDLLPPQPGLLTEHLGRFAQTTGIGLGRTNAQALLDKMLALPAGRLPAEARQALQNGWLIGRALEGDADRAEEAIRTGDVGRLETFLRALLWEMLMAGQSEQATAFFDKLVDSNVTGADADEDGHLMEAALLAGRFSLAANALGRVNSGFSYPERALRLRLSQDKAPDEAALFAFLTEWNIQTRGRAAALLAADDRFTGAGHPALAARLAFSLEGDRRVEAIAELARAWPGMRQE